MKKVFYLALMAVGFFLLSSNSGCNETKQESSTTENKVDSLKRIYSTVGSCTVVVYDKADHNNLLADVEVVLVEYIKKSDGAVLPVTVAEDKTNKIGERLLKIDAPDRDYEITVRNQFDFKVTKSKGSDLIKNDRIEFELANK